MEFLVADAASNINAINNLMDACVLKAVAAE
jgi:hypothetical protein